MERVDPGTQTVQSGLVASLLASLPLNRWETEAKRGTGHAQGHSWSQGVESGLVPPGTLILTIIIDCCCFCFTGVGRGAGPPPPPQPSVASEVGGGSEP